MPNEKLIGAGTMADALANEMATGQPTHGKFHGLSSAAAVIRIRRLLQDPTLDPEVRVALQFESNRLQAVLNQKSATLHPDYVAEYRDPGNLGTFRKAMRVGVYGPDGVPRVAPDVQATLDATTSRTVVARGQFRAGILNGLFFLTGVADYALRLERDPCFLGCSDPEVPT